MLIALLLKIGQEILPLIINEIVKQQRHGFAASDDTKSIEKIKAGLREALTVLEAGE